MPGAEFERYLRRMTATRGRVQRSGEPSRTRAPRSAAGRLAGGGITDVLDSRKAAG
jgi:hypothetical protein